MNRDPSLVQNAKRISGAILLALATLSARVTLSSPVARAQDDPRLVSINERISKTTPEGR